MRHIQLYENFIGMNDEKANRIIDTMNRLIRSVVACPSTKDLASDAIEPANLFNIYGMEKIPQILDKLRELKPKLLNKWDPSDEKYLATDHKGLKYAPTSQISHVINLVEYYIEKH